MYGLPKNTDLSFFIGRNPISVSFTSYEVIIGFDANTRLSITSHCRLTSPEGTFFVIEHYCAHATELCTLLEATVTGAETNGSDILTLRFDSGWVLEVKDDSEQFESFVITTPSGLIVV